MKLQLNPKSQITPFKNGIKFIGFHFYITNGEIEVRLDNGKKRAYRRKFNKMIKLVESKKLEMEKLLKSYYSWRAHANCVTNHNIFKYYDNKIKEVIYKMTIENGYYIAECTSDNMPISHKNVDTFYLPFDITKLEDGTYSFKEYRFNIPVNYNFPTEIIEYLALELDRYRKSINSSQLEI